MSKKSTIIIIILLCLALLLLVYLTFKSNLFFNQKTTQTPPSTSSLQNSYLFASPVKAKADGQEQIRITVILLDDQGKGISSQVLELQTSPNISDIPLSATTDLSGQAFFDLSSQNIGDFEITAKTQDYTLPQILTINYY